MEKKEKRRSEMGLGYGSEYQLLRFLGHHRQELEGYILKDTSINEDLLYHMEWLDFPKNETRKSLDGEHIGIDFLPDVIKNKVSDNWKKYWPKGAQNWDAILYLSPIVPKSELKDKWIIVEAKAHLKEGIEKGTDASKEKSIKKIDAAFKATKERFGIKTESDWKKKYYQFANRLAFVNFMLDNNIECSLLNIYFINGWPNNPNKNVSNIKMWKDLIRGEYEYLGINDDAKKYISEIFVKC